MSEALTAKSATTVEVTTPAAGYSSGEVIQLADGRAGYKLGAQATVSGDLATFQVDGFVTLTKSASVVIVKGGRVFWDKSANSATPLEAFGTNDFYVGTAAEDAASADTTVLVNLNAKQTNLIELGGSSPWETIVVLTAGTPALNMRGGTAVLSFSATAEAQKVDLLSKQSFSPTTGWILEGKVAIYDIGDDAALDINIGVANATHATDADSITESVFLHLDGNALDIKAESDDGTTEVAATDTTVNAVDDTYFDFVMDARDPEDIQIYIDGVLVLGSTVLKCDAATGPLKVLVHIEKTSNDTTADVRVARLALRTMDVLN